MNDRHTYLAALVDGGGTVPVEIGAVQRLVARGHRVLVLAEDTMAAEVRAAGATFLPWTEAPNRPRDGPGTTRTAIGSARAPGSCSTGCSRPSSSARPRCTPPTPTGRSPSTGRTP